MRRSGFTLVELTVSLAIIGLLAALLFPAVQSARESARRVSCQSNLRQIGLAMASYESLYTTFPSGAGHKYQILPFIDRQAEFELTSIPIYLPEGKPNWNLLMGIPIPLYACPSDPVPQVMSLSGRRIGGTNYAACSGNWLYTSREFDGMFNYGQTHGWLAGFFVRPADVIDGLSNTIAMSEIVHGDLSTRAPYLPHLRTLWIPPEYYDQPGQLEEFSDLCASIPPNAASLGWRGDSFSRGTPWFDGNVEKGMYNHVLTPNRPSCYDGDTVQLGGIYTATSFHLGGVYSLFGDGHVTFVGNGVDQLVWQRMASRADFN